MSEPPASEPTPTDDPRSAARRRLLDGLLGWHQPRPRAPTRLAAELRAELEDGLAAIDLAPALEASRDGSVWVTKTRLDRMVCDGYQLDPRPYEHTWENARGWLAHKAIERDWELRPRLEPDEVVDRAWQELASDRPGDPRSLAAWLNASPAREAARLRHEVAVLLDGFREVWPPLEGVEVHAEPRIRLRLAGGRVVLFGQPDVLLRSPVRDDRSRTLLVDLKTGRPRPERDRHELRFYALLATLDEGRPPFRWATFSVTEGRSEWEDLREDVLRGAVARVLDGVRQAVRLAAVGEDDLRLAAGSWCRFCLREERCEVAAADGAASHPDGMLRP